MKTFFIAEVGSNHDGDIQRAKALIDIAVESGADAVKFQLIKPFDPGWIDPLIWHCGKRIEFMATPFNDAGIQALRGKVRHWKVASTEAVDSKFVESVFSAAGEDIVFVSDGASGYLDFSDSNHIPMHCVVEYPAKVTDYAFGPYAERFSKWGLSDHTESCELPSLAVAAGARAIEKHFTDDCDRIGPDHAFALDPKSLKHCIQRVREVEKMFNNEKKIITTHVGRKLQWP